MTLGRTLQGVALAAAVAVLAVLAEPSARAYANPLAASQLARDGGAALARKQFDRAIELFDRSLAETDLPATQRASILNDRALAKWQLGQKPQAIKDFNEALRLYPEYAVAYNNRGLLLGEMGLQNEAVTDFDRALLLAPNYAAALHNRSNALIALGKFDAASGDFARAIELGMAGPAPFNSRALTHLAQARPFAALRDLNKALSLQANYTVGYRNRAMALTVLGRASEAADDFTQVLTLAGEDPGLLLARGRAHLAAGSGPAAMKDFTRVLELDPGSVDAMLGLAEAHLAAGNIERALEILQSVSDTGADTAASQRLRALAALRTGDGAAAISHARAALDLDKADPANWVAMAEVQEGRGDREAARASLNQALAIDPRSAAALKLAEAWDPPSSTAGREGLPFGGWTLSDPEAAVVIAASPEVARSRVVLERHGPGPMAIIEWTALTGFYRGLGLLHYQAGLGGEDGKQPLEYIAILDTSRGRTLAIEPYQQPRGKANWAWDNGSLTVTDAYGVDAVHQLRKPARPQPQVAAQDDDAWWGGGQGFSSWQQPAAKPKPKRKKKPKTLFDLLF